MIADPESVILGRRFVYVRNALDTTKFRNARATPAPHIQAKNMNKSLDKIWLKMLQNKANSTVSRPYFCSHSCLVCGGWGCKMIPHKFLRQFMRAVLSLRPKKSHRCVSLHLLLWADGEGQGGLKGPFFSPKKTLKVLQENPCELCPFDPLALPWGWEGDTVWFENYQNYRLPSARLPTRNYQLPTFNYGYRLSLFQNYWRWESPILIQTLFFWNSIGNHFATHGMSQRQIQI